MQRIEFPCLRGAYDGVAGWSDPSHLPLIATKASSTRSPTLEEQTKELRSQNVRSQKTSQLCCTPCPKSITIVRSQYWLWV